VNKASRIQAVS